MGYNFKITCPTCLKSYHPTAIIDHAKNAHNLVVSNEQKKTFRVECCICNASMSLAEIRAHLKTTHNLAQYSYSPKSSKPIADSPLDVIHAAEKQIQQGILSLEGERDKLHARIVEIDNLVARYKKFNGVS